jgi:hypothetical protein
VRHLSSSSGWRQTLSSSESEEISPGSKKEGSEEIFALHVQYVPATERSGLDKTVPVIPGKTCVTFCNFIIHLGIKDFQLYKIVVDTKVTYSFNLNCVQHLCRGEIVYV